MKRSILVPLCLMAFPAVSLAAGNMRDGLWEISTQMEMPGMPMKMRPTVVNHCYSKTDVADQKKVVNTNKDCTVTDMKTTGKKVIWTVKCSGQNAGTMTGETVFGKDSYSTVMNMKSQGHNMTMKTKAKRIGECR